MLQMKVSIVLTAIGTSPYVPVAGVTLILVTSFRAHSTSEVAGADRFLFEVLVLLEEDPPRAEQSSAYAPSAPSRRTDA